MSPERARYGVVVRRQAGGPPLMLVAPDEPVQLVFGDDPVPSWRVVELGGWPRMLDWDRVTLSPTNVWEEVEA